MSSSSRVVHCTLLIVRRAARLSSCLVVPCRPLLVVAPRSSCMVVSGIAPSSPSLCRYVSRWCVCINSVDGSCVCIG